MQVSACFSFSLLPLQGESDFLPPSFFIFPSISQQVHSLWPRIWAALLHSKFRWPTIKTRVGCWVDSVKAYWKNCYIWAFLALCYMKLGGNQLWKEACQYILDYYYYFPKLSSSLTLNKCQLRPWLSWTESRRDLQLFRNTQFPPWKPFLRTFLSLAP